MGKGKKKALVRPWLDRFVIGKTIKSIEPTQKYVLFKFTDGTSIRFYSTVKAPPRPECQMAYAAFDPKGIIDVPLGD